MAPGSGHRLHELRDRVTHSYVFDEAQRRVVDPLHVGLGERGVGASLESGTYGAFVGGRSRGTCRYPGGTSSCASTAASHPQALSRSLRGSQTASDSTVAVRRRFITSISKVEPGASNLGST